MAINNAYAVSDSDAKVEKVRRTYLTYSMEDEIYAIDIDYVADIIQYSQYPITPLPMVPDYIKGIINLRGKITPVIDIRARIGVEYREYDDFSCIIVLDVNNMKVGLIVDTVEETCEIYDESISPPPVSREGFSNKYVSGIATTEDGVRLLLNCEALLATDLGFY